MLYFTYALNFLLMIALPILLGFFFARRYGLAWRLFIAGGLTFIAAQVLHLPFNFLLTQAFKKETLPAPPEQWHLIFNAIILGLSAALFEEIARYLSLRYFLKNARSWKEALMFGAGHGGTEAIILGGLAALAYVNLIVLRDNPQLMESLPAAQLQAVQDQLQAYWSAPWYMSILGAVERILALCFHLSAAVLVMQTFLRKQWRWLGLAIVWHWLLDGLTVYVAGTWGALPTEGVLAVLALVSLAIIYFLHSPDPHPPPPPIAPDPSPSLPPETPPSLTPDILERSRYE